MKIVAIIQARMGSTRLPGKVMKKILDKPVILWDLERLSFSQYIDQIVVALPEGKSNDILAKTIEDYSKNIIISRGSENDVLDRYYQAALNTKADVVIRITSDCPLIDPVIVDKVVKEFLDHECDYCSNTLERTYPRGLDTEVMSFKALETAWQQAEHDFEREHVTPYIIENKETFKLHSVTNNNNHSNLRWTLDTKEDFEFIRTIYQKLHPIRHLFLCEDILLLLASEPEIININKYIEQKSIN